jgi:hypothetical protein
MGVPGAVPGTFFVFVIAFNVAILLVQRIFGFALSDQLWLNLSSSAFVGSIFLTLFLNWRFSVDPEHVDYLFGFDNYLEAKLGSVWYLITIILAAGLLFVVFFLMNSE